MWGNKIVGPILLDTNLNAEMYLNMQDRTMSSLVNENGEFRRIFDKTERHPIMVSAWAIVGSAVFGFLGWSPWPHIAASEVIKSQPTLFSPVGILESHGVPEKFLKHELPKRTQSKSNFGHNTR
jgi:hypothetical protein